LVDTQEKIFEFWGISVANARYHNYVPVSFFSGEFLPPYSPALKPGQFLLSSDASVAREAGSIMKGQTDLVR